MVNSSRVQTDKSSSFSFDLGKTSGMNDIGGTSQGAAFEEVAIESLLENSAPFAVISGEKLSSGMRAS